MQKPETKFRNNQVTPFLKKLKNCQYFPIQQLAIHDDPDFILCIRGNFVALELKADDGELRPLQSYKLDEVKRAGGTSLVAMPSNWVKVKEILQFLDSQQGEKYANSDT